MVNIAPRSSWTSEPNMAVPIKETQMEIYLHWPGWRLPIGNPSLETIAGHLRSIRTDHVNGIYEEIAYNYAVDQAGRVWELRGNRQCGANGDNPVNRQSQAILFLVGIPETPGQGMIDAARETVAYIRELHPYATRLRGHRESPADITTECPGENIMQMMQDGLFGASYPPPVDIPDFPEDPDPEDPEEPPIEVGLTVDGRFGSATVRVLQRRLGVTADGKAGNATWRALQAFLGTPVDGIVSKQSYTAEELGNGITQGWEYTGRNSEGSAMVRALQAYVGVGVDGTWFEGTTRAIQRMLNDRASAFTASDRP